MDEEEFETGTINAGEKYVPKTREQLKPIALGMIDDSIFTSMQISPHQGWEMIFMPLMFMNEIQQRQMKENKILHLYGETRYASPMGINGYPCLMRMGMLTLEEAQTVLDIYYSVQKAMKEI